MAVVIVGDFPDSSKVLELIQTHLGAAFPVPQDSSSSSSSEGPQQPQQQQQQVVPHPPLPVVSPESWQHSEPR
jgi:hypothetical protein